MLRKFSIFVVALAIYSLSFAAEGKNGQEESVASVKKQSKIPRSIDECFDALKKNLSDEEMSDIRKTADDQILAKFHLGIGQWMIRKWIEPDNSPLKKYFNGLGIYENEDMSNIILICFFRYLNKDDLRFPEQIKYYQDIRKNEKEKLQATQPKGE
ncbi:MAG: hypothetical protein PHO70_05620 [Candidatus Omnitrophica bacterium]|nr:hypothetical protein [Candidatus Omnitrophota bacterium]